MKAYRLVIFLASLSFLSVTAIQTADAQCRLNEGVKLTAFDADWHDEFGYSVSISGDVVVVGAHHDNDAGPNSGSAYVYRFDGSAWAEEQKLTASDAAAINLFGHSVSASGDVVVVGAIGDDDAGSMSGSAYVFRFNGSTWIEEQKLTVSDAAPNDRFGRSVSVSGDVAVVGADLVDHSLGAAYVYRYDGSTWIEEQKLTASDGESDDRFGWSVSINGDVAVVGVLSGGDACPKTPSCQSGSAYVYRLIGSIWVEEQKLTASDAADGDKLGYSVSISDDVIVLGAYGNDDAGSNSGSAYVYRFDGSTWVEEGKLTASDGDMGDRFGYSTSISGNVAVVGAHYADGVEEASGSAYVYYFDGRTWVEERKLIASEGTAFDLFSLSVSVSGDVAVVASMHSDDACRDVPECNSGAAYVFGINPVPTDPPCGAIDARQPSAPDGRDAAGWDSIALTFDEPPGEMNAEDFAVVISPPGDAPTVTDVTTDGNTATVYFDDIIPTGAWTTITHWPSGAVTRIGYLPADVDNDRVSNANDVLYLIDVLNGVIDPAPPAYQTDTDRSGATNANDVLRVIDLLNGAGVYNEHLDAELPV